MTSVLKRMSSVHIGGGYGDDSSIINRPSEMTDAEVRGGIRLLTGFSNPQLTLTPSKGERIVVTNVCIRNTDAAGAHIPMIWHNPVGGAPAVANVIHMRNLAAASGAGHMVTNALTTWFYLAYRPGLTVQPILTFGEVLNSALVAYNVYGFRIQDENKT